jgi:hypothetical protein
MKKRKEMEKTKTHFRVGTVKMVKKKLEIDFTSSQNQYLRIKF